ncbi:MAG: 4-(cytidine 5'-diphospho)-2-C-methyl-D-erythritol kinase [Deltaproteobacteria bacterium]|nr:4-(cytidine 5'-diphospho)-2-C-methyl-D-erythritol kinase [Deltaproteobacteria bacterium]
MEMKRAFLSPAKVNLFLRVLGKRPDGFHEILSLMQPVSLFDEVAISLSDGDGVEVTTDSPDAPGGSDNLAHRAAILFSRATGYRFQADIAIRKVIPVGAGLGGGSSNAATVLMALNELTGIGLPDGALIELAARLGSDVPFFILKGAALASGRGEKLQRARLPELHYVLINPGIHVSTAWAYSSLDLTKAGENNNLLYSYEVPASQDAVLAALSNDLEPVTLARHPEISGYKEMLMGSGSRGALMSGSGSTVFGVFYSSAEAEKAFEALEPEIRGEARIFLAKGL